jgi:DNA-binding transcriptional LysR family regulator
MANILDINLNLLKALDALLNEQNVSKAADRVGITQSAMSITLGQLREIYNDDLLVRGQQGRMQLTSFARLLIQPVKEALSHAEAVFIAHVPFDASRAERTFHIAMSDYIAFVLLPRLMQQIIHTAPNIKIVQHSINHIDNMVPFEEFELDVAIGDFQSAPKNLITTKLFTDRGVIVADKKHPAFKNGKLTLTEFLKHPQVFVALESHPEQSCVAELLKKLGHQVKINLMTPHTLIALQALPGTLLMTNTVERLARPFIQSLQLEMQPTPYKLPRYQANLYWHARNQNDPGHQWLRQLIKMISRTI